MKENSREGTDVEGSI